MHTSTPQPLYHTKRKEAILPIPKRTFERSSGPRFKLDRAARSCCNLSRLAANRCSANDCLEDSSGEAGRTAPLVPTGVEGDDAICCSSREELTVPVLARNAAIAARFAAMRSSNMLSIFNPTGILKKKLKKKKKIKKIGEYIGGLSDSREYPS